MSEKEEFIWFNLIFRALFNKIFSVRNGTKIKNYESDIDIS